MTVFLGDLLGHRVGIARFEQLLGDAQGGGRQGGEFGGLGPGVRYQLRGRSTLLTSPIADACSAVNGSPKKSSSAARW